MNKAVFLDRDGVLNQDCGYTHKPTDLKWLPGVQDSLTQLKSNDYLLLVVTNQSGVARGYYSLADVELFHAEMQAQLAPFGVQIDEFYVCPHHQEGSVTEYAIACTCRKPGTQLIDAATNKYKLDRKKCFLVGDKYSDIECGAQSLISAIQVEGPESRPHPKALAKVSGLREAVESIILTSPK